MGPIRYSLCHKSIFGTAMWLASLCGFPPLIAHEPLALEIAGAAAIKDFTVPVDKAYTFELRFEFPSVDAKLQDQIVGARYDSVCRGMAIDYAAIPENERVGLGRPIPIGIVIRRAEDRAIIFDRTFTSLCTTGSSEHTKWRDIGWSDLKRGAYIAEITNLEAQSGLEGVKTDVSLISGDRK